MSLKKLTRQLRREVLANPKKAAILGLLALVALWFWAPLMRGWIAGEDTQSEVAAKEPTADAAPPVPAGTEPQSDTAGKKVEISRHPWQQLVQWMDNDPQTLPAIFISGRRDPFQTPKTKVVETKPEDMPADKLPDATPQSLGMVLSSTIVGADLRIARINGQTYQQGKTILMSKDGQQFSFTLAEVHPRRVLLERNEKQFELTIPTAVHSGRIETLGSN